jgi:hypothetical protein
MGQRFDVPDCAVDDDSRPAVGRCAGCHVISEHHHAGRPVGVDHDDTSTPRLVEQDLEPTVVLVRTERDDLTAEASSPR